MTSGTPWTASSRDLADRLILALEHDADEDVDGDSGLLPVDDGRVALDQTRLLQARTRPSRRTPRVEHGCELHVGDPPFALEQIEYGPVVGIHSRSWRS